MPGLCSGESRGLSPWSVDDDGDGFDGIEGGDEIHVFFG